MKADVDRKLNEVVLAETVLSGCPTGDVLDARVDVYAFGASFYEVLTKSNPFRYTDSPDLKIREERTRLAHLRHTPPAPSTINPDMPEEFDRIIMRCLEPKRVNRYDDFSQVQDTIVRLERKLGIETAVESAGGWGERGEA